MASTVAPGKNTGSSGPLKLNLGVGSSLLFSNILKNCYIQSRKLTLNFSRISVKGIT